MIFAKALASELKIDIRQLRRIAHRCLDRAITTHELFGEDEAERIRQHHSVYRPGSEIVKELRRDTMKLHRK